MNNHMTDFQSRLDALPPMRGDEMDLLDAALALIALTHDLARAGDVRLVRHDPSLCLAGIAGECTCGRDALLAKLEGPK